MITSASMHKTFRQNLSGPEWTFRKPLMSIACPQLHWFLGLFSSFSLLYSKFSNPPPRSPLPELKHAERSRQVFSSRPERSVLRVLTFHPGWTWGGTGHPPQSPAETQNTTPTSRGRAAWGVGGGGMLKDTAWQKGGGGGTNKLLTSQAARNKDDMRTSEMSVRLSSYPGSRCRCLFVAHWALRQQRNTPPPPVQLLDTPSHAISFYLHNLYTVAATNFKY